MRLILALLFAVGVTFDAFADTAAVLPGGCGTANFSAGTKDQTQNSTGRQCVEATIAGGSAIIGTVAIDQTTPGVTNGVAIAPSSAAGVAIVPLVSASGESSHVFKASPGNVYSVSATNLTATAGFLVLLNATASPGDGAIAPTACALLPANGSASIDYNPGPAGRYGVGIVGVVTSATTCFTKTTGTITAFFSGAVQ